MNIEDKNPLLGGFIGGVSIDYFVVFCKECGAKVPRLDYDCRDSVGVRLMATCDSCGNSLSFKLELSIQLAPVEEKRDGTRFYFKALSDRKLRDYRKALEQKRAKKTLLSSENE